MKCVQCGVEIHDYATFCPKCGAKQALKCNKCGAEIKDGAVFCNKCGAALQLADESNPLQEQKTPPATVFLTSEETINTKKRNAEEDENVSLETHPWRRCFARVYDISICFAIIFAIYVALVEPYPMNGYDVIKFCAFIFIAAWLGFVIDTLVMTLFNTTIGKLLFNIKVKSNKALKITFGEYFDRNMNVLIKGLWLCIPLISIVPLVKNYEDLMKNKSTQWDRKLDISVHCNKISIVRWLSICIVGAAIIVVAYKYNVYLSEYFSDYLADDYL